MSHPEITAREERGFRKCLKRVGIWFDIKDKEKWLKEMRGSLSMTASIIATMTFELATNPPGGVLQANFPFNETDVLDKCQNLNSLCPGEAVMAVMDQSTYQTFFICNTISFVASLSVCLLLVSGIPLNHTFPIWLLSIGMCITITSLALTYMFAAEMVTPDPIWGPTTNMFSRVLLIWISLLGVIGLFFIIRFFVRGMNKCSQKCNGQ